MGRQRDRRRQQQRQKRQEQRQQTKTGGGIDRLTLIAGAVIILAVLAVLGYSTLNHPSAAAPARPTAAPIAKPIDGIGCGTMEYQNYHIHQHITLYDQGKYVPLPSQIGMPGGELNAPCYYWIHVHMSDPNIIHVESPVAKTFTLGNFFDIWQKTARWASPPGDTYVNKLKAAARKGQVVAYYNGKRWTHSYRSIPLTYHAVITIEIGKPTVAPKPYTAWHGE